MTDSFSFRSENYPRIYKKRLELAAQGYMVAGVAGFFAVFCLLVVAIKYHGDFISAGVCGGLAVIGPIVTLVALAFATVPRLILTVDAIEYRDFFSIYFATRRIRRDDIKGVYSMDCYYWGGGIGYDDLAAGSAFMPKDEKASALFVPEWKFAVDEAYDNWVGSLPYLGGSYNRYPFNDHRVRKFTAEEFSKVEWRDHRWMPRKNS